ncbi:hypothetical protein FA15DRAFT_339672 [Coprinopsis marcescibilis]|uniref:Uncharacterized protein n=1 Tax=Coprinopsis marcescibilis TaxID=230819 RepID=A0A5C3LBD0_COPMA|nr:hypothetical protein FA15DRAFT_339672 [Coprinopsis marcescibilis]
MPSEGTNTLDYSSPKVSSNSRSTLQRTRVTRIKQRIPVRHDQLLHVHTAYPLSLSRFPESTEQMRSRVSTFQLLTHSPFPSAIDTLEKNQNFLQLVSGHPTLALLLMNNGQIIRAEWRRAHSQRSTLQARRDRRDHRTGARKDVVSSICNTNSQCSDNSQNILPIIHRHP